MSKRAALVATVLAIPALAAALVPWPVGGAVAQRWAEPSFKASGLDLRRVRDGHLSLLPLPRLLLEGVEARHLSGHAEVTAESLRGTLQWLPLLSGRMSIAEVSVRRPELIVDRAAFEESVRQLVGLGPQAPERPGRPQPTPTIQSLAIVDGSVRTRDNAGTLAPVLTSVSATVTGLAPGGSLDLTAALDWHGERLELRGSGLQFARAQRSEPTPMEMIVTSDLVNARLTGQVTGGPQSQMDGDLLVKTTDADRLSSLLGVAQPLQLSGFLEMAGTLRIQPDALSLSDARLGLPSGQFDGVLGLRMSGDHLALEGTLATDRLDLTEVLAPLLPVAGPDGWSRDAYPPDLLPPGTVDIRLSAGQLVAGRTVLSNAALTLLATGGRLDVMLSQAEGYKGTLKGRLSASPGPAGYDVRLSAALDKVDAALAMAAVTSQPRLSGLLSGTLQVEGAGASPHALMHSLEGRVSASLRQGEILGVNVPDLLRRIERRPLLTASDARGGRTAVDAGATSARISKGILDMGATTLRSSAARILLTGQVSLAERSISLSGLAQAVGEPGSDAPGLPFDIVGPFDDLQVVPDAKALIRRSGAAAPFLQSRAQPGPVEAPLTRLDAPPGLSEARPGPIESRPGRIDGVDTFVPTDNSAP